jgi:ribosomal protein S18 acetylase RimI-like enzyme
MYTTRAVTTSDLETICLHRELMFAASGRPRAALKPMTEAFRLWLPPKLASGDYFGWMVEHDRHVVAGLGMIVIDWPPHPSHPTQDVRGYILNVYVAPEHRRRGLAEQLMARAKLEGERRGLDYLVLHATDMGRPMYEKLGWKQTAEMGLHLAEPV